MKLCLLFFSSLLGAPFAAAIPTQLTGVNTVPSVKIAKVPPTQTSLLSLRLRGGADTAATKSAVSALCDADNTAKGIACLSVLCSVLMTASPEFAMTKIFKTNGISDMSPNEKQLVENNGISNLSTGLASALLVFTDTGPWQAIALGCIPRFIVLAKHYLLPTAGVDLKLGALLPVYGLIAVCISAMLTDKIPLEAAMAAKIIGGIYLVAGTVTCLAPATTAEGLNLDYNDNKVGKALLRSQGKTDMVNGGLFLGLGLGYSGNKAIGLSCVAWTVAILLCDAVMKNYVAMGSPMASSVIQLAIALFASKTLFL